MPITKPFVLTLSVTISFRQTLHITNILRSNTACHHIRFVHCLQPYFFVLTLPIIICFFLTSPITIMLGSNTVYSQEFVFNATYHHIFVLT